MNRNRIIGVLAHVDAGKTTLSEAMLYLSGTLRKAGRVDHGDTFLDTNDIERDRGITIFSSQARMKLGDLDVILLDTPGHVDFSAETERTLQVLDYAVLVISGTDGVQSHTRTLWRLLELYRIPVFLFVNKMDLPGAEASSILQGLQRELSPECVDFTMAVSEECSPSDRSDFEEALAMCSDALLDEYMQEGSLSSSSVTKAIAGRQLFPVWFGSALHMQNVRLLMDGLEKYTLPYTGLQELAGTVAPEAFGARVYKIGRDAQGARLTYIKVTGGSLHVKDPVRTNEKADQLRLYSGEKYELTGCVECGGICAVTGITEVMPGDGLGAETTVTKPVLEPVMTRAMLLPQEVSAQAFFSRLRPLEEEDPSLHLIWDENTREIRAQIMGDVQIEVLTRLIEERFGVRVTFGPESILYKETILTPAVGIGHFEPLRHYAEVHLLLEPGERGSGITVSSLCPEDVLDLNWQRLILTHVLERDHPGVLTGSPLTDVRVTLLTGRAHIKHTEGGDFRQATYRAIRQGLKSATVALLEPWYRFILDVPSPLIGRALSDLSGMHAETGDPVITESRARLEGRVPVSRITSYVTELNAYTHGEGSLSLAPSGYDLCSDPEAVLAQNTYDSEADPANPTGSVFCAHGAGFLVPWDQVPSYAHCEIPRAVAGKLRRLVSGQGGEPLAGNGEDSDESVPGGFNAGNGWGRNRAHAPENSGAPEEDAMFLEVFAREFGTRADGTALPGAGEMKKAGAPGYKKKGPSARSYPEIRQKYDKQGNPIYPKKDTREDYLIVDGYNMIFQWEEFKLLAADSIDAARTALLDLLSNYQGFTGQKVSVVFDAYRTERTPESKSSWQNVEVVFTKKGETADAYIEREVHEKADRYKITVATSDNLEQLTVLRLGALRMSAGMLAEEIRRVTAFK